MIPLMAGLMAANASGGADPYFANVVSLLHFDGPNGSTTFTDVKGKTYTAAGDAQITTTSPLVGSGSLLLDGAGDYVTGASHADYAFGTGDFTIECFEREAVTGTTQYLFNFGPGWIVYLASNDNIYFNTAGANQISNGIYGRGSKRHVALTRASGIVSLWYEGSLIGSWNDGGTNIAAAPMEIGRYSGDAGLRFNGVIDEWRVTKGVARYTAGFTPPTGPFPDS